MDSEAALPPIEIFDQGFCSGVAARGFLFETAEGDPVEIVSASDRRLGVHFPDVMEFFLQSQTCGEEGMTCEQFVEQHAECVDVCAHIDDTVGAGLLRTHVSGRADEALLASHPGELTLAFVTESLGDAEVDDLHLWKAIDFGHEEV